MKQNEKFVYCVMGFRPIDAFPVPFLFEIFENETKASRRCKRLNKQEETMGTIEQIQYTVKKQQVF